MPTWTERLAARLALAHAQTVYARFSATLCDPLRAQALTLRRVLRVVRGGAYARRYRLDRVSSLADLRRAAPIVTYEQLRPTLERVLDGDHAALFRARQRILMFATSSGTTARQKTIPVTPAFVRAYRRGWNTFGLKLLSDHPAAVLRAILQGSGRMDESQAPSGIPCGAITGLMARTQKHIVRRFYVAPPELARIDDPQARYYALMRFGVGRDVAFCITANPATLIRMATVADEQSERLIRDVRDGTLSADLVADTALRRRLERRLRPNPQRAAALEEARRGGGVLRPADFWKLEFLACWTGGSMGHYLGRVAEWYGPVPVRDVGLLASEGRVSIPLQDGTPAGALDLQSAVFEFIPSEQWNAQNPDTLTVEDLEPGETYSVVLTNDAGLIRYRLDDVIRVTSRLHATPLVEFLHRAGRVASVAGEKLTEDQVVGAAREASARLGLAGFDFVIAPRWSDPPFYQVTVAGEFPRELANVFDSALCGQNAEYHSRRKSLRLAMLRVRKAPPHAIEAMDRRLLAQRRSTAEQFKRPCLLTQPGQDDELLNVR